MMAAVSGVVLFFVFGCNDDDDNYDDEDDYLKCKYSSQLGNLLDGFICCN